MATKSVYVNDGGSTTHTSSSGATHGGAGAYFGSNTSSGPKSRKKQYVTGTVANIAKGNQVTGIGPVGEDTNTLKTIISKYYGNTDNNGGGYRYSAGTDTSSSGGGYHTSTDDVVSKIKALLDEQKRQADDYYRTLFEQATAQNQAGYETNRNLINRNKLRADRYIQGLGGEGSGAYYTAKANNMSNWQRNLATNRQDLANNNATAQADYNRNLANTASTLAQGWYNYVLPVYTNRQQHLDDYDYKKYLASL